jgi:hypothetical protein
MTGAVSDASHASLYVVICCRAKPHLDATHITLDAKKSRVGSIVGKEASRQVSAVIGGDKPDKIKLSPNHICAITFPKQTCMSLPLTH